MIHAKTTTTTTLGLKALAFWSLVAVALTTLVFASPAWPSGPAKARIVTHITLAESSPFHGKVLSRRVACERNRTVKVYRVDPGPDGLFGTTTSNADGEWSIPAGIPHGTFYAVAKPRSIGTDSTTLCKRAVSREVTWE